MSRFATGMSHGLDGRMSSSRISRTYKLKVEKFRIKEELTVMILDSDGNAELYSMTRNEILEQSKMHSRRLRNVPFGEMKLKDLRMLDPNMSFGSEPKIVVRTLCVMVSINPIHAFVLPDRILMIVPDGADGILQSMRNHLKSIIQASHDQTEVTTVDDEASNKLADGEDHDDDSLPDTTTLKTGVPPEPLPFIAASNELADGEDHDDDSLPDTTTLKAGVLPEPLPFIVASDPVVGAEIGSESPWMQRSPSIGSAGKIAVRTHRHSYVSSDETPFQFVALELIFDTAALSFKKEVDYLKLAREKIRSMFDANELFTKVNALRSRIIATRETVEEFMSDEKDLGLVSYDSIMQAYGHDSDQLSSFDEPVQRNDSLDSILSWEPYDEDINEIEDLAEDFVSRLDDAVNEIDMLKFAIEEIHSNLKHLANERNERLMKCHIRIQGVACLAAPPTLVSGLFGMNMYSGVGEGNTTDFWVTFAVLLGGFVLGVIVFIYLSNKFFLANDFAGMD